MVPKGGTTDDAVPTIKGKTEPGATVVVYDGGKPIGTTTADGNGDWTLTPASPLLNGPRDLTAVATDPAGNPSAPSDPYPFIVDSNGPVAPAITRLDDNVGAIQGPIQKSGVTDDTTPTVVGTAGANLKINVYDNGTLIGSTTSDSNGDWSLTPVAPLTQGVHGITATAVNAAGVESAPTGVFPFTIDTTAPGNTTLDRAIDDVGPVLGNIPSNGTTNDATPTFQGKGEPGTTVTVYDNGQPIGTTTVDPGGQLDADADHAAGRWPAQRDRDGHRSRGQHQWPDAGTPVHGGHERADRPGHHACRRRRGAADRHGGERRCDQRHAAVARRQGAGQQHGRDLREDRCRCAGVARHDAVGCDRATGASRRRCRWPKALTTSRRRPPTRPARRATSSTPYALIIDTTAPKAPVITAVNDDVGSKQGLVANNGATDDTTPSIVGTGAKAGETIQVFDGATLLGTTTVKSRWHVEP